jgi:hemolysin III
VEYYIQLCEAFGCTVDPSVATAIKTNWSFMQVTTRSASEPSLLPLAFCLEYMPFLKNLGIGSNHTVSHRGDGNWICRSISNGLMSLKALRILDLQRLGIDGQGLCQIADAICALPSLTDLILRYNYLGHAGGTDALVTIVKGAQPTLTFIDVSCNSLGYFNVRRLEQAATQARNAPPSVHILDDEPRLSISSDEPAPDAQKPKTSHKRAKCCCPYELSVEGNFVLEEVWNSVLHGIGVLLGLIGTWDLITKARGQSDTIFWACLVYGMSATTLFTASTLYHSTFLHERARKVFQMLDHCAIFILIAGTYTPIGLIALSNQPAAVVMVAIEWLIALVGIAIYLVSAHFPKLVDSLPYVLYEVALYVIMGHMCFMSYEQIIVPLSKDLLFTLMLGGLLYVVGVVFFILEQTKRIPIMHCIWHVFVLAAAIVHFFSVRSAVVNHLYESAHSEAAIAASKPLLAGFPRF